MPTPVKIELIMVVFDKVSSKYSVNPRAIIPWKESSLWQIKLIMNTAKQIPQPQHLSGNCKFLSSGSLTDLASTVCLSGVMSVPFWNKQQKKESFVNWFCFFKFANNRKYQKASKYQKAASLQMLGRHKPVILVITFLTPRRNGALRPEKIDGQCFRSPYWYWKSWSSQLLPFCSTQGFHRRWVRPGTPVLPFDRRTVLVKHSGRHVSR